MSNFEFISSEKQIQESNIFQFMQKYSISHLEEFSQKDKDNLEWFWESVDKDIGIIWDVPYTKTLDISQGIAWPQWFVNGKTNIYKSSVEKFVKLYPQKTVYHFVSEDGKISKISYLELDSKISKLANGLKSLGVKKGDVIAIYLPMIEEAILTILASSKIGAIQTVIFSGYSSESLHMRLQDCKAKILLISDGFYRKGKPISQKEITETVIKDTDVEKTIIVSYKEIDKYDESEKIIFYDKLISSHNNVCNTEILDSEDPLFILYTSGTTGKPKGVVHTHGGFSVLQDIKQHI